MPSGVMARAIGKAPSAAAVNFRAVAFIVIPCELAQKVFVGHGPELERALWGFHLF